MVKTSLLKLAKNKEIHRIIAAARQSGEWEPGDEIIASIAPLPTHTAQEWAITANKAKLKVAPILPKQYQRHAKIFSENGVQQFPLSWSTNMVVRLKPGTPDMLNCKVYPLSRAETEEWNEFVTKNKKLGWIKDTE
jgi:hypothetical protein